MKGVFRVAQGPGVHTVSSSSAFSAQRARLSLSQPVVPHLTFGMHSSPAEESFPSPYSIAGMRRSIGDAIDRKLYPMITGLTLSVPDLKRERAHWEEVTEARLNDMANTPLTELFPSIAEKLSQFSIDELEGYQGIPPLFMVNDSEGRPTGKRTHGLVAAVGMDVLKNLPPVDSAEAAIGQLWGAFGTVYRVAGERGKALQQLTTEGEQSPIQATTMAEKGMRMYPLKGKMFSSLQVKTMVLITRNGAIQCVSVPEPSTLLDMLAHDPQAMNALKAKNPLRSHRLFPMVEIGRRVPWETTLEHLRQGNVNPHSTNWSDVHTLLQNLPFDLEKHIEEGRLTIQMDKPGLDGKTVWDAVHSSPINLLT